MIGGSGGEYAGADAGGCGDEYRGADEAVRAENEGRVG